MRRSKGTTSRSMGASESRSQAVLRRSQRLLGVSIPSNGSNLLGPRRSDRLRLCKKSARTVSKSSQLVAPSKPSRCSRKPSQCSSRKPSQCSSRKPSQCSSRKPSSISYLDLGDCPITFRSLQSFLTCRRNQRRSNARRFWYAYADVYDSVSKGSLNIVERKHILASNRNEFVDKERSHGIMWVAVHGADFICAVFKNKAPDMKRILKSLGRGAIMHYFGMHVLWDMEELAERSDYRGKPFAVVSLTRGTHNAVDENCYKASGDGIDEEKAIEFLKRAMARESTLTKIETIKTAIAGFHYLFKEKLMPEDFWVTFFHDDGNYHYFESVDTNDIKIYLKAID